MRTDENGSEVDKKTIQAADPKLVDEEIHPVLVDPLREAKTAVPERIQIEEEADEKRGKTEGWHTFKTP